MSKKPIPAMTLKASVSIIGDNPGIVHRGSIAVHWADETHRYHAWLYAAACKVRRDANGRIPIHKNALDPNLPHGKGYSIIDGSAKAHADFMAAIETIVTAENIDRAYAEAEEIERTKLRAEKSAAAQRVRVVLEDVGEDVLPARLKAEIATFTDEQILRFAAIISSV